MRAPDEAEIVACIPHLRRYARGLHSNSEHADDLVQDTLERAWSKYSMWQRRGEVRAWMFGIMHNLFIDRVRSQRTRTEESVGDDLPDVADRDRQGDQLEVRDLDSALQRLPPELREVLLLVGVEELSYQDVATALGIPIGTVMSRLSRARERLRAELDGRRSAPKIQRVK
ncbi:RNA polymerase sigma factor [Massilia oculi]|jgi:RNA polymerase sigma-70 factor (ECF subfamily)|uniref:RNA polymerase subunit sigma-24 n=1 Tax=Massilia oculi TaxID=945844 RepID=A0A2S2DGE2_9BURK|nr:RNA polymerase sigma factor [Massilia oculi]AWL03946.1 RNA polymerase subunit sigma-24 [Massilia oculi]